MSRRFTWFALLALALSACRTSTTVDTTTGPQPGKKQQLLPPDRKLNMGSQQTQTEINDLLARVPSATPSELFRIHRRLWSMGEPAVSPMCKALSHPTPKVRTTAAFVLGQIKDPRSLQWLAAGLGDVNEGFRFEVATAMLRMDDKRGLDTLIYGLEHADPLVRARSILVLKERTGVTRGYKADDPPVDRSAAVARWRAWASSQGSGW